MKLTIYHLLMILAIQEGESDLYTRTNQMQTLFDLKDAGLVIDPKEDGSLELTEAGESIADASLVEANREASAWYAMGINKKQ